MLTGVITQVISDHSPCVPELKKLDSGDLMSAWGGIASLQLGLPAVWTRARERGCTINQLARWMALQTAELVKLEGRKGTFIPNIGLLLNPEHLLLAALLR